MSCGVCCHASTGIVEPDCAPRNCTRRLERKSAFFLKLAQEHRHTWGFDDEDVEIFAVHAGIRFGEVC